MISATRVRAVVNSPAFPYVGAVIVRAGSRAVWGLALPAVLTVAAYGRYQLLATVAVMVAQLALLGTPQAIVRHTGQRIPMGGLLLHAAAVGAVMVAAAPLILPTTRSASAIAVLSAVVLATVVATTFGARAKARFAFGTSWRAEVAGAAVLILATTTIVVAVGGGREWLTPGAVLVVESIALAGTAAVLVTELRVRRDQTAEAPAAPFPALLGNVYSVGGLVLLDVVLFRRLEVYFLERSPDGLAGVAVLGLALQIASVALLVPTTLLEAWQPKLALIRRTGSDRAFEREVRRRAHQLLPLMVVTLVASVTISAGAVGLLFREYQPWLWCVVAFVAIRVACAGAGLYSAALYAVGAQRVLYVPALVGGFVAVASNTVFTRPLGLGGAVLAYCLTQVTVAMLTVVAFRRSAATPLFPSTVSGASSAGSTTPDRPRPRPRSRSLCRMPCPPTAASPSDGR